MPKITKTTQNGTDLYSGFDSWPTIRGINLKLVKEAGQKRFHDRIFDNLANIRTIYEKFGGDSFFKGIGVNPADVNNLFKTGLAMDIFELLGSKNSKIRPSDILISFQEKDAEFKEAPTISLVTTINDLRKIFNISQGIKTLEQYIKRTNPKMKDDQQFPYHISGKDILNFSISYINVSNQLVQTLSTNPKALIILGKYTNIIAPLSESASELRKLITSSGYIVSYDKAILNGLATDPEYAEDFENKIKQKMALGNKSITHNTGKSKVSVSEIIKDEPDTAILKQDNTQPNSRPDTSLTLTKPATAADVVLIERKPEPQYKNVNYRDGYFKEKLEVDYVETDLSYLAKQPAFISVNRKNNSVSIKYSTVDFIRNTLNADIGNAKYEAAIKEADKSGKPANSINFENFIFDDKNGPLILKKLSTQNLDNIKLANFHNDLFAQLDAVYIKDIFARTSAGIVDITQSKPEFDVRGIHQLNIKTANPEMLSKFDELEKLNHIKLQEMFGRKNILGNQHDVKFSGNRLILNEVTTDMYHSYYRPLISEIALLAGDKATFKEEKDSKTKSFKITVNFELSATNDIFRAAMGQAVSLVGKAA